MYTELSENKKFLTITSCTKSEYEQLVASYTKYVKNYRHTPLFKKGLWDGSIKFVNVNNIPACTYKYLEKISKEFNWPELVMKDIEKLIDNDLTFESFRAWADTFFDGLPFKPRDYQLETAFNILKHKICLAELATGGGKTLICFTVIAYLIDNNICKKIFMVVPSVQLVTQSSKDFLNYNTEKLSLILHQAYAGSTMNPNANIVIGTYQTLTKYNAEFYRQFDCVIVDECHKAKTTSIKTILEKCWHCDYRFGVSGTMPDEKYADAFTIQTYLGPIVTEIKAKQLQDEGYISRCDIVQMRIDYASDTMKQNFANAHKMCMAKSDTNGSFSLEKNFVIENEKRFNFISDLISMSTKNTLVLFHRIKYGKKLFKHLKENCDNKRVYYIDGSIDKRIRTEITDRMDKYDDVILVASFATLSTGISVNHIYNVVFTESFKSPFVIIQSIGRALRLKDKENTKNNKATIIDIVDDLRYGKYVNYLYKHGIDRMKLYKEQKYPVQIKKIKW